MAGVRTIIKGEKGQYLGSWAKNHKTKDTLLSQTLKVESTNHPQGVKMLIFWLPGHKLQN